MPANFGLIGNELRNKYDLGVPVGTKSHIPKQPLRGLFKPAACVKKVAALLKSGFHRRHNVA